MKLSSYSSTKSTFLYFVLCVWNHILPSDHMANSDVIIKQFTANHGDY